MSVHWGGRGPGHTSRWPKAAGTPAPPASDDLKTKFEALEAAGKLVSSWFLPLADPDQYLTLNGANVEGWTAAYGNQKVDLAELISPPQWDASAYSGKGTVTFNGSSQYLTGTGNVTNWPDGSQDAWMLVAASQDSALSQLKEAFSYGSAAANERAIRKTVVDNLQAIAVTNISTSVSSTSSGGFSGAHTGVSHVENSSQQITAYLDGVAATVGTRTGALSLTRTRVRLGASSNSAAAGFWLGSISCAAILNSSASSGDALALEALMRARLS